MQEAEATIESGRVLQQGASGGGFDATLFVLLLAVVAFVSITNLWLRWRSQGLSFGAGIRRLVGSLGGRRHPPGEP